MGTRTDFAFVEGKQQRQLEGREPGARALHGLCGRFQPMCSEGPASSSLETLQSARGRLPEGLPTDGGASLWRWPSRESLVGRKRSLIEPRKAPPRCRVRPDALGAPGVEHAPCRAMHTVFPSVSDQGAGWDAMGSG
jgi:hypothetical protein